MEVVVFSDTTSGLIPNAVSDWTPQDPTPGRGRCLSVFSPWQQVNQPMVFHTENFGSGGGDLRSKSLAWQWKTPVKESSTSM